jgi:hypothetical protein
MDLLASFDPCPTDAATLVSRRVGDLWAGANRAFRLVTLDSDLVEITLRSLK